MEEKKYLKWYNKVGYGCGDIAGNVVYALLAAFVMIFLTDTVGLNAGIVGVLIAVSKVFDGISDIFFGAMIDKTKSRMGKARPWMFYGYFGCAVCLVAIFSVPASMGKLAQYIWFFIAYTLLNAGFYTANNIAYSALTALVTRNNEERVQMGSIRFMFAFGTNMLIQAITVGWVARLGGGAAAWRTVAIVYAVIGVIANTLSVFSVRELSDEERLIDAFRILVRNKYFLMICGVYLLMQLYTATLGMGIYYMKYVLGNERLFGTFSWAVNIPMIAGLVLTPALVQKFRGMYRLNPRRRHRWIPRQCAAYAPLYSGCCARHESAPGRHERADRDNLRVHASHNGQKSRRDDVFLHILRNEGRRRTRDSHRRLDARRKRLCAECGLAALIHDPYAPCHVPLAPDGL